MISFRIKLFLFILLILVGLYFLFFRKGNNQHPSPNTKNTALITLLNKAFADEWLAYYQYWIGAQVIQGKTKQAVIKELEEHADDELRHAKMLSKRIVQLGGIPLLTPQLWYTHTECGYLTPNDFHEKSIVVQNIAGEQCAIRIYYKLATLVKDTDPETYKMVKEILNDEIKHEADLQKLLKTY